MDNNTNTNELQEVIKYINDILVIEFPTNVVTQEYLVTALLDNKKCHVNMLLENCLMSRNIEELKNIFVGYLKNHSNPIVKTNKDTIPFDTTLQNVLNNAVFEKETTKSLLIGTEHILLSMLNPKNNNLKMQEIFKNVGIDYNFVLNKCNEKTRKIVDAARNAFAKKNIQSQMQKLPLKSEINSNPLLSKTTTSIQNYTTNITKLAEDGKLDELIGRKTELNKIVQILARRKKNNVVLVGNGGCGKTELIHGLAILINRKEVPDIMKDKQIVQLNVPALIAGTYLRGAFEERVKGLFDEMKASGKYILFIDDIHTVLKSSSKEKDTDISSMINDVLAGGEIKVVAATSFKDYRNSIEINTMLSRRLQKIVVEPTSKDETIEILMRNKHYYEDYHNVNYTNEAITRCVELAERYITDRCLPDSAIDVIDFTGAHTCLINRKPQYILDIEQALDKLVNTKSDLINNGDFEAAENLIQEENHLKAQLSDFEREYNSNTSQYRITITEKEIYNSISEITNIPINKLSVDDKKNLVKINDILKRDIIGQDEAIDTICRSIKRNRIGLGNQSKVIASYLCVGPTGVGKTYLAKKIAEEVFGDSKYLIRFDMSEYSDKSSVSKLIGANSGYIGYENGGLLCEAIKNKPYCVLLIDEIEKANTEIFNLFLQILDEGMITDNTGNHINCKNAIVLFTSNVGAQKADALGNGVGFVTDKEKNTKGILEKELKNMFKPEFLNRLDQVIYFNSLTEDTYKNIVKLELDKIKKQINNIGYDIVYTSDVVDFITNDAFKDKKMGARPIIRYLQKEILDKITDLLIINDYPKNHCFKILIDKNIVIS